MWSLYFDRHHVTDRDVGTDPHWVTGNWADGGIVVLAISFLLKITVNNGLTLLDSQRIAKNCMLFTKKSRLALYYQHTFGNSFAAAKSTIAFQAHQVVVEITGLSQFSTLLNV